MRYLAGEHSFPWLRERVTAACWGCPVSRPFVSRPLPQVYGAIRGVILRQAYTSLRSGVLAFLVLLAPGTIYLRTAFARLIPLDTATPSPLPHNRFAPHLPLIADSGSFSAAND